MALTLPPNGIQMTTHGQSGEELDQRTTSYNGVTLRDFSTAHFGDNICVHYHFHDPFTPASRPSESRASQSTIPETVHVEPPTRPPAPVEEPGEWSSLMGSLPCKAFVTLRDQHHNNSSNTATDPACDVELQVMGDDLITNSRRHIVIAWKDSRRETERLWLPGTHISIARQGPVISMDFSDCNQMMNPTTNYINNYTAVYAPTTPNVGISLEYSDEHLAAELEAHLLHYKGLVTSGRDRRIRLSEDCRIWLDSIKCINGESLGYGLCVWTRTTDPETGQRREHLDLGCFTPRMDFEFIVAKNIINLCIRGFMKMHYVPVDFGDSAYWPAGRVRRNSSGAPAYMHISLNSNDNALTVQSARDQSINLLDNTIGVVSDAKARDWFIIDYIVNLHVVRRNKEEHGQLTIWEKEEHLYGLIRKVKKSGNDSATPPDDKDTESSGQIWRAIRWKKSGPYPEINVVGDTATLQAVESVQGDYLSISKDGAAMFEPPTRDDLSVVAWEEVKIEFKFSSEEVHRFAGLFNNNVRSDVSRV